MSPRGVTARGLRVRCVLLAARVPGLLVAFVFRGALLDFGSEFLLGTNPAGVFLPGLFAVGEYEAGPFCGAAVSLDFFGVLAICVSF